MTATASQTAFFLQSRALPFYRPTFTSIALREEILLVPGEMLRSDQAAVLEDKLSHSAGGGRVEVRRGFPLRKWEGGKSLQTGRSSVTSCVRREGSPITAAAGRLPTFCPLSCGFGSRPTIARDPAAPARRSASLGGTCQAGIRVRRCARSTEFRLRSGGPHRPPSQPLCPAKEVLP